MSKPENFEVGDRVKFALPNGKIEEGTVRAVIPTTTGSVLNTQARTIAQIA